MSQLSKPSIDFGLKFLKLISSQSDSKNVLLSPLSVIIAYCMALEGAAGETEKQIKEVLNLDKIDSQNGGVSELVKKLLDKHTIKKDEDDKQTSILEFANLFMANSDFKIKEIYVQSLMTYYSANVFNEDFSNGQNILEKVNSWVSEKTKNKISTILSSPPEVESVCLLVNTIYFEGKWLKPFSPNLTLHRMFYNSDGTVIKAKMMTIYSDTFNFFECHQKKLKIVQIPYVGNISMILILPTYGNNIKKMIDDLDSTELSYLIDSMTSTRLDTLTIPKFKLEDNHQLHEILPKIGMTLPFGEFAEFPKIAECPYIADEPLPLSISRSIQKALIEVSETGTIATAATSIEFVSYTSLAPPPLDFIADRPFLFFIRDDLENVNLFTGQLNNLTFES